MKNFRARIVAVHRTLVHLHSADAQLYIASISEPHVSSERGTNCLLNRPTVGDWVIAETVDDDRCRIVSIEPRTTTIVRRSAGGNHAPQLLAANVDTAFIFSPLPEQPNVRRLARLVALALSGNVIPVIVLSRADTVDDEAVNEALERVSAHMPEVSTVVASSTRDGGLLQTAPFIWPGATVVLLGPSGAGKSTMLNAMAGNVVMQTGATRTDGAGRHTTTHRALFEIGDGVFVIDTPGLRAVGVWAAPDVSDQLFREIAEIGERCRFRDCTHQREPGCAVREAIRDGVVASGRWEQWEELRRETAFLERSEEERRRRERQGSLAMRRHLKDKR